jgi:Tat protein secretion system quality control protein TatD with DNase activity
MALAFKVLSLIDSHLTLILLFAIRKRLVKSRNEPIAVISVLEILSKLHNIDVPELEQVILGNTRRLFS